MKTTACGLAVVLACLSLSCRNTSGWGSGTGSDTVCDVVFSPAGGVFTGSVDVVLTCATVDALIYYTLDNSDPDESSTQYTAPFTLPRQPMLRPVRSSQA